MIVEGQGGRKSAAQKLASAMVALLMIAGCAAEPENFREFRDYIAGVPADQRDAAGERHDATEDGGGELGVGHGPRVARGRGPRQREIPAAPPRPRAGPQIGFATSGRSPSQPSGSTRIAPSPVA